MSSYHFVGIGGIGMSAIARILLARGEAVSGSDLSATPLVEQLRSEGARIAIGHDAGNVLRGDDPRRQLGDRSRRNPECAAAARLGIQILHRGEMLAALLAQRRGIAVCGTHGKTTTTAMTHAVLRTGGIDAGLVLGGIDVTLGSNAYDGIPRHGSSPKPMNPILPARSRCCNRRWRSCHQYRERSPYERR